MAELSSLRRRVIEDMTVRNLSSATQGLYVHGVAKFGRFFGRSSDTLGLDDGRTFQVHLVAGGISWQALNQIVCALRFLYGGHAAAGRLPEQIAYAREPQKLPVVVGTDEVVRFLEAVPSLVSVRGCGGDLGRYGRCRCGAWGRSSSPSSGHLLGAEHRRQFARIGEADQPTDRSGQSSAAVKKKRRAATVLLNAGGFAPNSEGCSYHRRVSSGVAVSGERPRKATKRETIRM